MKPLSRYIAGSLASRSTRVADCYKFTNNLARIATESYVNHDTDDTC